MGSLTQIMAVVTLLVAFSAIIALVIVSINDLRHVFARFCNLVRWPPVLFCPHLSWSNILGCYHEPIEEEGKALVGI